MTSPPRNRIAILQRWIAPALAATSVLGIAAVTAVASGSASEQGEAVAASPVVAPAAQAKEKPSKAETDAFRGRVMACLARNGARVERLPDGGYSVFLSKERADDDGQTLQKLTADCQAEQGYSAVPPPAR